MKWLARGLLVVVGVGPAALAYAVMLGLGLHRHGPPWMISLCATVLVFGPPLLATALTKKSRVTAFGGVLAVWALGLLAGTPVYFPGERKQAFATGMALVGLGPRWEGLAHMLAEDLPAEPQIAEPEVPEANALVDAAIPPGPPLEERQEAIPYEGAGRRLSVPITFESGGKTLEDVTMMLDTGATYTTMPESELRKLGIIPPADAPTIQLHTANGDHEAKVVLLDKVWLGHLEVDSVAVAVCDSCSSTDTIGLLGLNVTGGFNLVIDADRREVVFSQRVDQNRRLDVQPYIDLGASLSRYPGGRIEVVVHLKSQAPRPIGSSVAEIRCGKQSWTVELDDVPANGDASVRRRLPEHDPCDRYQVALQSATW